MSNTTFIGSDPTWANACVGNNGEVNYFTYAKGFSNVANLLLDWVLENSNIVIDSVIYPICFNMRHSIELHLKGAIKELEKLSKIKKVTLSSFNLVNSHDIGNIWIYFKNNSEILDYRFKEINNILDKTISDIAEIDSTGQVFRYPFNKENKKHLTEQRIINCVILRDRFRELEKNLSNLKKLSNFLMDEYNKGTFIKTFSRSQIFNLVQELPMYTDWRTDLDKKGICDKYNLSQNDLSKILNFIKNNYEISLIIGIKKCLITLSDEMLIELSEMWINVLYPEFKDRCIDSRLESTIFDSSILFERAFEYINQKDKVSERLKERLNICLVADLWALYYISDDTIIYSEDYIDYYKNFKQEIERDSSIFDNFYHIFSKRDFLERVIKNLFFLQQIEAVEKIIENNKLEKCINGIYEARNRSLFKKWKFLDYKIY